LPRKPKADARSVHDKALGLLARREHSARELKAKLAARGHDAGETAEAVERLRERDWQSDERFGTSVARQRIAQGYGPRRVAAELRSHGLADAAIRALLAALEPDWGALAAAVLRRRTGAKGPENHEQRAREAGFLLRRGFDPATVRAVTRAETGDPDAELD
jgi:regulatory protein